METKEGQALYYVTYFLKTNQTNQSAHEGLFAFCFEETSQMNYLFVPKAHVATATLKYPW